ncbi:hypothetical protein QBC45DRAFT_140403 [Copromyces sp. CBS 386.78]|nr:hypothetical protein QBC45DRAFT_140403 [Copromyces sp. CBS 386.78]
MWHRTRWTCRAKFIQGGTLLSYYRPTQQNFFSFACEFYSYRRPIGTASNLDRRYHALKGGSASIPALLPLFRTMPVTACHLEACLACLSTLRYHYQGVHPKG